MDAIAGDCMTPLLGANSRPVVLTHAVHQCTRVEIHHRCNHAQVAAGLTDAALPKGNCAVRIMLFVGGPTSEGGGQVVDKELSEPIRSHKVRSLPLPKCTFLRPFVRPSVHHSLPSTQSPSDVRLACAQDLVKETASFYKKARKFYDALAGQLVRQGHALDIFACSLDQARMGRRHDLVEFDGGLGHMLE